MSWTNKTIALAVIVVGVLGRMASAGYVTFTGADLQTFPGGSHPNASVAAANFDAAAAALGTSSIITFESAPVGSFSNLTVAPGVTINGTDINSNNQIIKNTPNASLPTLDGFNTTPGGTNFVEMAGGNLIFTFAQPTQFFGAYLTGVQTNFFADSITFNDGTSETITVPGTGTSSSVGEAVFVGFTDAGKSITSITINAGFNGFDAIGVDDVRYQSPSVVPEPSSLALCGIAGVAGLVVAALRRERAGRSGLGHHRACNVLTASDS